MKKKTLSIVIAVVLTTSFIQIPVYATPEQPVAEQQVVDPKEEANKYRKARMDKQKEINELNSKIDELTLQQQDNQAKVDELNKEIKNIQKEIDKNEPKIKEKEKILGKRIREVYKSGGMNSYLSVFINAESTGDVLEKMDTIATLINMDKKSVDEYIKYKKKHQLDIKSIEKKKSELSKVDLQIKRDKKVVDDKKAEFDKFIEENKALENELKTKYPDVFIEEERNKVLSQFNMIDESSDYATIESAIAQLQTILDSGDITMDQVIQEINDYIDKGQSKLEEINNANSVVDVESGLGIINTAFAIKSSGAWYGSGGTGPDYYDCSGFVQAVLAKNGITIGRTTYDQMNYGTPVSQSELIQGDIVFSNSGGHVGIYVGNGQYIHAANPAMGIIVSDISYDGFHCAIRM